MISGEEIRQARERSGLTQSELAQRIGVSMRTVGNWERGESVPRNREGAIKVALADQLTKPDQEQRPTPLQAASDAELLAEIARRFSREQERSARSNVHQLRPAPTLDYSEWAADDHSGDSIGPEDYPHDT